MKPLLKRYALERNEGERFGDFCIRIGMIKPTTEGKTFHEDVSSPISFGENERLMFSRPPKLKKMNDDQNMIQRLHFMAYCGGLYG